MIISRRWNFANETDLTSALDRNIWRKIICISLYSDEIRIRCGLTMYVKGDFDNFLLLRAPLRNLLPSWRFWMSRQDRSGGAKCRPKPDGGGSRRFGAKCLTVPPERSHWWDNQNRQRVINFYSTINASNLTFSMRIPPRNCRRQSSGDCSPARSAKLTIARAAAQKNRFWHFRLNTTDTSVDHYVYFAQLILLFRRVGEKTFIPITVTWR
jgi:hypothetical protein